MKEDYEGYYDFLKKEINKFKGNFDNFILYIPEFFKLLCDLLNTNIKKQDRIKIACVLGYFVSPRDIIPEEIYGPAGYIDDIFLCTYILNDIKSKYGISCLRGLWNYDEDIKEVLDYSYKKSLKIVEEKKIKDKILKYIGLK